MGEMMPKEELRKFLIELKNELTNDIRDSFRRPSKAERWSLWITISLATLGLATAIGAQNLQVSINTQNIASQKTDIQSIKDMQNLDKGKTEEALRWIGQSLVEIKQALKER